MSSLAAAYHGYEHQDIVVAYAMAGLLLPRLGLRAITAERKTSDRDRFDDLQTHGSIRLRAQVKAHTSEGRVLRLQDLTTRAMDFRIDDVLAGAVQDSERVDQYRLFTTFGAPQADFLPYLQSATMVPPLLSGVETQRFTLIVDAIWPAAADPIWAALKGSDRDDFLDFCARFVLETGCPNSSHDLREPGPFESLLLRLLRDEIGIGYFPNDNRDLSDAAAHLIYLAHGARAEGKTIEAAEVIRTLALRVDYGRVSDRFPVVEDRMVLREEIVGDIERDLRQYTRVAVTASPGMGKSWLTHQIGEKLRADGWLVLTHYCFVDLFDNDRFRRASIRTTLGTLMAQLVDQERSVLGAVGPRFAVNAEQFELMLKSAAVADPDRPILIVVDGIDHIDRLSDAHDSAAGLSAQLATLSLPTNAFIVVSSQPGKFLEEYTHAGHELSLRSWPDESIRALLSKSSLVDSLHSYGFETNHVADEIVRKAAGSPLYATYLARTAIAIARADPGFNDAGDIGSYLASAPAADPDLSSYYAWLIGGLTADLGVAWLSETLSWIDFPITADELKEITPMFQAYVDPVLGRLAPVLTQPSGRAGVRIYHESFQRYIRGRVSTGGADRVKSLLKPVIEWLDKRGFYADLRAFRWLFSVLKYAGRGDEIPGRVGDDFVISAVAHGQPGDAVVANIAAAARQAALTQDWTSLVRLHEIARSADNLYAWRLNNDHTIAVQYGRAFGSLHGVRALADRLLNDGKCTFQPGPGLLLCMACDAGAEIPPWSEYLEADELDDGSSGAGYGPEGEAEVGLARITARMRLGGRSEAVPLCVNFLSDWRDGKVHPLSVAGELASMYGEEALGEVVAALPAGMSRSWARFALAQIAQSDTSRREQSELAIADGLPFEFWTACLRLGANPLTLSWDTGRLTALTAAVVSEGVQFAPATLQEWLTGLAIAQAKGDQNALLACSNAIEPDTWYHKWLLFCIVLARHETTKQILEALRTLSEDIRVFHGKPRACDLYSLTPSIHRSFGRALGTIVDGEAITLAIRYLAAISRGTTTWMQGTRDGPLTFDALVLLVLDSLSSASDRRITVIRALAEQFAAGVSGGEFYDTHATDCLLLCRLNVIAGNGERATEFWNKACTYLAAYGWHKDITAYDVIDPIEALGRADPIRTRAVLKTAQPIVEGVLVHTDGKSTSGLYDRWLNLAAQIHPEGTLNYLARSAVGRVPAPSVLHRFITKAAVAIDRSRTSALALSVGWLVAGMRGKSAFQTALLDLEAGIQSGLQRSSRCGTW